MPSPLGPLPMTSSSESAPTTVVKRLYFIRHGETDSNAKGVLQGRGINDSLNDRGRQQAEHLSTFMSQVPLELVVTSNLERAKQTAQILLQRHDSSIPVLEIEDLAEISWGTLEGTPTKGVSDVLEEWNRGAFDVSSPNGESPLEVERRAIPVIYKLLQNRPETTIVFILHGRLMRIILSSLLYQSLDQMGSFTHHNTSINILEASIHPYTQQQVPEMPRLPNSLITDRIYHPSNIQFNTVLLDGRDHLPLELQPLQ